MGLTDADKVAAREDDGAGPIQDFLAEEARRHRLWLVGGSIPLRASEPGKMLKYVLLAVACSAGFVVFNGMMAKRMGLQRPPIDLGGGVFLAGDHVEGASIQGALLSGRRIAEAVLQTSAR